MATTCKPKDKTKPPGRRRHRPYPWPRNVGTADGACRTDSWVASGMRWTTNLATAEKPQFSDFPFCQAEAVIWITSASDHGNAQHPPVIGLTSWPQSTIVLAYPALTACAHHSFPGAN